MKIKRNFALLLVIVMLMGLIPQTALADTTVNIDLSTVSADGTGYTCEAITVNGKTEYVVTITDSGIYTLTGTIDQPKNPVHPTHVVVSAATADIILNGVSVSIYNFSPLSINPGSTVNLTLADGTTNTLTTATSTIAIAGVYVPTGATVIIGGTGTLNAAGCYDGGAGIGGGKGNGIANAGSITINSGIINATGGWEGAGIGGGDNGDGGTITINGGIVNAAGRDDGAGIGGGRKGTGGSIAISGGTVTATGYPGYSIGRGIGNYSSSAIKFTGGSIKANDVSTKPSNGTNTVYFTTVTVIDKSGNALADTNISCTMPSGVTFDSVTDGAGKLYLWLPVGNNTTVAFTSGGVHYKAIGNITGGANSLTAAPMLTGTATIDNTSPRIGDTLTGSLVGGNNTGTLTYIWKADGTQAGTGISYTVTVVDLGKTITLEITSSVETGIVTSTATTAVAKKAAPSAPSAPTFSSKTHNSVTLTANATYEFSKGGTTWQTSNEFSGLTASTAYTFYQRVAETADTEASAASTELNVTTDTAPVIDAAISPTSVSYDLASPSDASTTIAWNSAATVTDVVYGGTSLASPVDYVVSGSALTIKNDYLSTKGFDPGDKAEFTISFDKGASAILTVNIVNNYTPGTNADLSNLAVGGSTVSGFDPGILSYNVELLYDTQPGSAAATLGATAADPKAGVSITQAVYLPGSAAVAVTAENGTKKIYTISFTLKSAPPVQSSEKNVSSVITPTDAAISGTNISATVENSITSQVIDLSVSAKANWKLYSDTGCSSEITDKTMTLSEGPNTVYVRVTAEDSSTKDYTLTITRQGSAPNVSVTGISLNKTNISLYSNTTSKTETLVATVSPGNAANKAVSWTSNNSTVATVDANGKVTAMGNGTATITATTADGGFTASCTVTVTTYTSNGGTGGGGYTPAPPASDVVTEKQPNMPTTAKMSVNSTEKDGIHSATITEQMAKDAIKAAQEAAKKSGKEADGIALDFNVTGSGGYTKLNATIEAGAIDCLKESGVKFVKLGSAVLDITLDAGAISEIDNQSTGVVTISATRLTKLSGAAKNFIGNRPVFNITVGYQKNGKTEYLTNFGKGAVTLGIAYKATDKEKTGNLFGVYVDKNGKPQLLTDSSYDNSRLIFSRNSLSTYGVGYKAPAPAFTDTAKHWAKNNIDFVSSRDLISGTSATTFAPDTAITRADFLMALGRLSGVDVSIYKTSSFTDVKASDTTMPYIEWAVGSKIVSGYGDGKFGPNDLITREQMAVMMQNYAKATGYNLPVSVAAVTFSDNVKISSYAKDAVKAIQQAGIMQGKGSSTFDPQGNATRGEASTILRRFVELVIDEGTARGWVQNDAGQWQYIGENGKPVTGWLSVENAKYYFTSDGIMVSGKWLEIEGKWYYFYADGSLAKNAKVDGYEVDENGVRKTK